MDRRVCILGFHGTVTIGERVLGRLISPGTVQVTYYIEHTPSLSVKGAYFLILEPQLINRLQVRHTGIRAYGVLSRKTDKCTSSWHSPLA